MVMFIVETLGLHGGHPRALNTCTGVLHTELIRASVTGEILSK